MERKIYDIAIVGGGTAGCACAWTAAKLGLKTILIEKKSYLGGAITSQLVVPAMKTDTRGLNTDFYDELVCVSNKNNAQITYSDGNTGWLNPLRLPTILTTMLEFAGCEVLLNTDFIKVKKEYTDTKDNNNNIADEQKILSLYTETNYIYNIKNKRCIDKKHNNNTSSHEEKEIYAKYFVDATGDANFSKACGASFLTDKGVQALSLRFIMAGVDKKTFAKWLLKTDPNRQVTTAFEVDNDIHLSTACTWDTTSKWALKPIFDLAVSENTITDEDRAYFQVFSIAGESDKIAFNCPRLFSDKPFDPSDKKAYDELMKQGTERINRLEKFCQKYLKGFEKSYVYKIADELGVRESRRVKGKYILTKEDIYNAREFRNPVAYSNYPIDVHSIKRDDSTLHYIQKTYSVPLESLITDGFENLFTAGRCLSADFYAQAAVRIQPTCFSMGEGVAKHIAALID